MHYSSRKSKHHLIIQDILNHVLLHPNQLVKSTVEVLSLFRYTVDQLFQYPVQFNPRFFVSNQPDIWYPVQPCSRSTSVVFIMAVVASTT